MSRILAIETSTVACSVAVTDGGRLVGEEYTSYKLKHSEKLLPLVKHLLEDVRMELGDIDCFAVGAGPGSFTGLRIAAATVKAFAHVGNRKIVSVSSLDACAEAGKGLCDLICVMADAQRNDVYYNIYDSDKGFQGKHNEKDAIIDSDRLISSLSGKGRVCFMGDGVFKNTGRINEILGPDAFIAGQGLLLPRASAVAAAACIKLEKNKDVFSYDNYLPNYIRPSSAEEQLRKRKML